MALRLSSLSRRSVSLLVTRSLTQSKLGEAGSTALPFAASHRKTTLAPFSDTSSSSYSPIDWYRNRQERKEEVKYRQRLASMSTKPVWTVGDMLEELEEVVKSWIAKMPILSNNKETKMAKQMHKSVLGIVNIMGSEATSEQLEAMSRTEKLKAALQGETTAEEINILIMQFQTMNLMHRVLRKRIQDGKPLPESADAMQTAVQSEGSKLLTKGQKSRMMDAQARKMKNQMRRK